MAGRNNSENTVSAVSVTSSNQDYRVSLPPSETLIPGKRFPFDPPGEASVLSIIARSTVSVGEDIEINIAVVDDNGARAKDYCGTIEVADLEGNIIGRHTFTLEDSSTFRFTGVQFDDTGIKRLTARDMANSVLKGKSNPIQVLRKEPELNLYWGDVHWHSTYSQDVGITNATLEYGLYYSYDVANMDFCIPTDHDICGIHAKGPPFNSETWQEYINKVNSFHRAGVFATLVAYEWTSRLYGHKNVYTPRNYLKLIPNMIEKDGKGYIRSPYHLWDSFRDEDVVTVPHHVAQYNIGTDWDYHNEEKQRLVEIYSHWGNGEYKWGLNYTDAYREGAFVQDALARGYRMGFLG